MRKILLFLLAFPSIAMAQYTGLQFDGGGDYVTTGFNGIAGSGSRTVQCWFKGFSSTQMFLVDMGATSGGNGARFSVKLNPSSSFARVEIGGGGITGTVNIANNFWHQVTVVYDNAASTNKYKIYVDGVLDTQGDIAVTLNTAATAANPVTLGIRTDLSSSTDLFGSMDDVRIWSIPLSAVEVSANYNQELCGTPTGLAAYYKMDEGTAGANNTAIVSLFDEVTPASVNTLSGFSLTGNTSNYTTNILALVDNSLTQTESSCGNFVWAQTGQSYNATGLYYDTVAIASGCDSVYILDLTIAPLAPTTITASNCTDYFWAQSGLTYTSTGMYNDTLTAVAGCDSIVILDLTITPLAPNTISQSSCIDYTWAQNGLTYNSSGMYADTILTSGGCDSIVILDLTINGATSSTVVVNTCTDYLWTQSNITYTTSGSYFNTIPNSNGCDSVVELVLTIASIPMTSISIDECSSYLWTANNQNYTSSGTYQATLISAAGCDSVVELTLSLFSETNTVTDDGSGTLTADVSGATYQWIHCLNNSAIAGATSQSYAPPIAGGFAVITTTATCVDTSICVQVGNAGIEELGNENISVYPNPTNGVFVVENNNNGLIQQIFIRDMQGKLILSEALNESSHTMDISQFQKGVYLISVQTNNGSETIFRIVKK